jgi:hypothetical protein
MSDEMHAPEAVENVNVWSLDAMRDALAKRYAPLVFSADGDQYTLVSLMRLSKQDRKEVAAKLEEIDTDDDAEYDEDKIVAAVEFVIKKVTKDRKGAALVKLLGGDMAALMMLITRWTQATQPGEASDSEG